MAKFELLTLYAEKIPASRNFSWPWPLHPETARWFAREYDVAIYRDRERTDRKATIRWDNPARPDRRNRYINLNCYRWRLEWLEPEKTAA